MKKINWSVEQCDSGYYVLKTFYIFGFHLYSQIYGVGGHSEEYFEDLIDAEHFLELKLEQI